MILFFLDAKEGKWLIHVVWDSHPLNPPFLKQQSHIQEKQRAMNQRPWMKQCCPWGERKVSLFETSEDKWYKATPWLIDCKMANKAKNSYRYYIKMTNKKSKQRPERVK